MAVLVALLFWEGAFVFGNSRRRQLFHRFELVLERQGCIAKDHCIAAREMGGVDLETWLP